ncbi:MAG TPA: TetR/AcrR family transcriptional regulator [Acidimicrobiales bacterium]
MGETVVTTAAGDGSRDDPAGRRDGRAGRAARTRAAVVDALLTLNDRGHLRPTARDIAEEAGVSLRSLYVHFDDLEALFVAAAQRQAERLAAALPPLVAEGTLPERLDAFLARRTRTHEVGAGVRKAAVLQAPFSPAVKQAVTTGRKLLRSEVARCFAPEIDAAGDDGARLLRALDVVASPSTWDALRDHHGLTVDEATADVRAMVLAFLATWAPHAHDPPGPATTATRPPASTAD